MHLIINNLDDAIRIASKNVGIKDYKTVLQEKLQIHGNVEIKYTILKESGPDHNKVFESKVECDGKLLGKGSGKTKKSSEMAAAKDALDNLKEAMKVASNNVGVKDYKTVLQEKLQIHGNVDIKYTVTKESGPDHNKVFESKVECNGKELGIGVGKSKKASEMAAAIDTHLVYINNSLDGIEASAEESARGVADVTVSTEELVRNIEEVGEAIKKVEV